MAVVAKQDEKIEDSLEWVEAVRAGQCSNSSFYWPIRFLDKERREAMWVLYAFCHEIDDIADGHMPAEKKTELLHRWQSTLIQEQGERSPVVMSMIQLIKRFELPKQYPIALTEAMLTDVHAKQFPPTLKQLEDYCYGVASVVGLMTVRILGVTTSSADPYAMHLGQAFQLTNIIRDVVEDAKIGRCYMPKEWLDQYGLSSAPADIIAKPHKYQPVLRRMGDHAAYHYKQAAHHFPVAYHSELRATRMMWSVYEALFDRMEEESFQWREQGYHLPKWKKLWCVISSV